MKQLSALAFWLFIGLIAIFDYVYLFSWLLANALTFQWGFIQAASALIAAIAGIAIVSFLTIKINNILVELTRKGIGWYTVYIYMIDTNHSNHTKGSSSGERAIQIVGWVFFVIAGFWGVSHLLLSLMDAL